MRESRLARPAPGSDFDGFEIPHAAIVGAYRDPVNGPACLGQHRRPGGSTAIGKEAADGPDAPLGDTPCTGPALQPDAALDLGSEDQLPPLFTQPALQLRAAVGKSAAVGQFASRSHRLHE